MVELAYDALAGRDPRTLTASGEGYEPVISHMRNRLVLRHVESGRLRLSWPRRK